MKKPRNWIAVHGHFRTGAGPHKGVKDRPRNNHWEYEIPHEVHISNLVYFMSKLGVEPDKTNIVLSKCKWYGST